MHAAQSALHERLPESHDGENPMTDMKICRICHHANWETPNLPMVKTGVRHNVHWTCKLDRLPDKEAREQWILSLWSHQLEQSPALLLDDYGLLEFVRRTLAKRNEEKR